MTTPNSSSAARGSVSAQQVRPPIPYLAGATVLVGLATLAAGVSLVTRVSGGRVDSHWLALVTGAWALVLGGAHLASAFRMFREGLAAISEELGPIASIVASAAQPGCDRGRAVSSGEIESAAWVQVLLVSVALVAALIAVTSFPSRFPWESLVPIASMGWPAFLRIHAARTRLEASRRQEQDSRDRLADEVVALYARSSHQAAARRVYESGRSPRRPASPQRRDSSNPVPVVHLKAQRADRSLVDATTRA